MFDLFRIPSHSQLLLYHCCPFLRKELCSVFDCALRVKLLEHSITGPAYGILSVHVCFVILKVMSRG